MSSSYGSSFGWTLYQPTPINDAATGILGALGVVVALHAWLRGGTGQKVGTSLAQASTWHQAMGLVVAADAVADVDVTRSEHGSSALVADVPRRGPLDLPRVSRRRPPARCCARWTSRADDARGRPPSDPEGALARAARGPLPHRDARSTGSRC